MLDLHQRFRELDRLDAPDMRTDIEQRAAVPSEPLEPAAAPPAWWRGPMVAVATAFVVLVVIAAAVLVWRGGSGDIADTPTTTTIADTPTTTTVPDAPTIEVPSIAVEGGTDILATTIGKPTPSVATCPAGSRPDEPGPTDQVRPFDASVPTAFDRQSGKVVVLLEGPTWAFDVCSNTWTRMNDSGFSDSDELVYDADSDLLVDIDSGRSVFVYDVDSDTWRALSIPPPGVGSWFDAFYDPVSGLIVTRNIETAAMWAYDVDTDIWAQVDQGHVAPAPYGAESMRQTMVYDPGADRVVLHAADNHIGGSLWESGGIHATWTFDLRAGVWSVEPTATPDLGWGWGAVYDESEHLSVFFGDEVIAGYDASTREWRIIWQIGAGDGGPYTALPSGGAPCWLTYDPVNERILAHEGDSKGIWAFDSKTATWIELLSPEE